MKIRRSKNKPQGGIPQPDKFSTMSRQAVDIAVSEITGTPLELLCGYVLFSLQHTPDEGGAHLLMLSCMDNDYKAALPLAEHGLVDLRNTLASQ